MHFTRPRELIVAGVAGLVAIYLLFQVAYGSLPELPTFAGVTFAALAVIETVLAFSIRSRIKSRRIATPIGVARAVALAKASSLAGALMTGAWLAAFAYVFPRRNELAAAADDRWAAVLGTISSAALVAAALWLEHCCRTPHDSDQESPRRPTG